MRIHRVEIEGFGPFRARQTIDLDAYAGDGIFLISGRTGAGKSSILDAICFALYGSAPRYEDGEKRLRSDHAEPGDPTEVALEFTTGGRTWRIERSPDFFRPKKRGGGLTPQKAEARMYERVDGEWVGRAARPVDVGQLVDEVIGLSQQQFLQVILLAQGRFARFLLAKNDERQALLRTLFGTRRFEEYERQLQERAKDAGTRIERERHALLARLEQAEGVAADVIASAEEASPDATGGDGETPGDAGRWAQVDPVDLALEERIERAAWASLRARHLAEAADAAEQEASRALAAADAAHTERTSQRAHQQRRTTARERLAELEAQEEAVAALRAERDEAERAEAVRGAIDAGARALQAVDAATVAAEQALRAWLDAGGREALAGDAGGHADGGPEAPDSAALDAFATEAQRRIGAWEPLRAIEERLERDAAALEELRAAAAQVQADADALAERADALPGERARVQEALDAATALAGTLDARAAEVTTLEAQLAAARARDALAEAYREAAAGFENARQRKAHAEAALDELHRRRFAGIAGELAERLVDGEACEVCGSTTHPAPAARNEEPVTPEAIEAAENARADATVAYEAANAARNDAQRALGDAETASGGRAPEAIEADLAEARRALADAQHAAAERERLAAERARLDAEGQAQEARRTDLAARRSELEARIASSANALERDREAVAVARGTAGSVAERIRTERRLADLAAACAEAQREQARAEDAASDAADRLAESVVDAGFADVGTAQAALRPSRRREEIAQLVREHETARAATRATLMGLELEMLPEDPVDTDASAAALDAARAAWREAVAAKATAAQRAESLEDAVAQARAMHDGIAELARDADAIRRLADTVAGRAPNAKRMKLETFVLAAELEEIVAAANVRLAEMSADRYRLQHSDALAARGAASGLGLEVMDRFTGRARPPHSLSGGETFLASLALALGLAEVVTNRAGGIRLDTLFIDEGFGSLDAETLDVAMRTLDELRQGGRTVGVISHVEAMKEQIPAQLRVEQTPQGWSVVRQDTAARV